MSDISGAYGDNCKALNIKGNSDFKKPKDISLSAATPNNAKKKLPTYTPLFRWIRGKLELATLPHILSEIVEVDAKMPSKKRWANGMSDDELDSSDEEWDDDRFVPVPSKKVTTEISALTTSAYEDEHHPLPTIVRSWISPDLKRFSSRKSAIIHAEELVQRDLLIDRTLYGYGKNGVRLRPVKPTRKIALEAGMARFLRDGVWVVGQEEMWIERRRDILRRKQVKQQEVEVVEDEKSEWNRSVNFEETLSNEDVNKIEKNQNAYDLFRNTESLNAESNGRDTSGSNNVNEKESKVVSPTESDASSDEEAVKAVAHAATGFIQPDKDVDNPVASPTHDPYPSITGCNLSENCAPYSSDTPNKPSTAQSPTAIISRSRNINIPPFSPSTHYRLTLSQIDQCYAACIEHYEKVMFTVKARSLHHELSDGFDVLRERGRGRYDMELPAFETPEFSFLTDPKKAAWMPIIHKILGEDAQLVHKGCFLSLPGSETQVYHQDGLHLNKKNRKPCHAVNVFIPLVDYDMSNGPTEFCLGSHFLGYENFVKEMVYTPCVTAGTPVIFDYRLGQVHAVLIPNLALSELLSHVTHFFISLLSHSDTVASKILAKIVALLSISLILPGRVEKSFETLSTFQGSVIVNWAISLSNHYPEMRGQKSDARRPEEWFCSFLSWRGS